ncbi:MAG: hypothetical protein ACLTXH_04465 [Enterobacter hormaechei]
MIIGKAYMQEKAEDLIGKGLIDAVAGRDCIANPDLVARLQKKAEPTRSALKASMAAARKVIPTTLL